MKRNNPHAAPAKSQHSISRAQRRADTPSAVWSGVYPGDALTEWLPLLERLLMGGASGPPLLLLQPRADHSDVGTLQA